MSKTVTSLLAMLLVAGVSSAMVVSEGQPQQAPLTLLTNYSSALCLDGSPGGYYYYPATTPSLNTTWVVFLQGGGACAGAKDCYARSLTVLGTSTLWPRMSNASVLTGSISRNCTLNPDFCQVNLVFVNYCDGFLYTGHQSKAIAYKGHKLYYRGSDILRAVYRSLEATTTFSMATDVLLSGCSAGGAGTFIHSDKIASWIHGGSSASSPPRIRAMPLSGFFLNQPNVEYSQASAPAFLAMLAQSNGTGQLNQECVKGIPEEPHLCFQAEFVFSYSKIPTFVINSKTDAWQIPCILFAGQPKNSSIPYECLALEPWRQCIHMFNGEPAPGVLVGQNPAFTCTAEQMAPVLWYQVAFMNRVREVEGFRRTGSGAFISSCLTHCEGLDSDLWAGLTIGGVTMQQAVSQWWRSNNTAAATQRHHDCTRQPVAPFNCNPTCHPDGAGSAKKKHHAQQSKLPSWFF